MRLHSNRPAGPQAQPVTAGPTPASSPASILKLAIRPAGPRRLEEVALAAGSFDGEEFRMAALRAYFGATDEEERRRAFGVGARRPRPTASARAARAARWGQRGLHGPAEHAGEGSMTRRPPRRASEIARPAWHGGYRGV